jgi:hypothetical protein
MKAAGTCLIKLMKAAGTCLIKLMKAAGTCLTKLMKAAGTCLIKLIKAAGTCLTKFLTVGCVTNNIFYFKSSLIFTFFIYIILFSRMKTEWKK